MDYLRVGKAFTKAKVLDEWRRVFYDSAIEHFTQNYDLQNILQFTNLHFKTTEPTKDDPPTFKIKAENPNGFELISYMTGDKYFESAYY